MTIGERIRKARTDKGLTLDELGKLCSTTRQTIYKYECGVVTNIPLARVEVMANALGVTPAYIMGWPEKESISDTKKALIDLVSDMDEAQLKDVMRYIQFVKQG